mgnify:CR=1 FL=1
MQAFHKHDDQTLAAIDQEATSEADKRDSRIIYQALQRNRAALGGQAALPAEDRALSEKILTQARSRSAEIAASQHQISARQAASGAPIPWWLWLAWLLAIGGLVAAWWYFR